MSGNNGRVVQMMNYKTKRTKNTHKHTTKKNVTKQKHKITILVVRILSIIYIYL